MSAHTLAEIEASTKNVASARDLLASRLQQLQDEQEQIKRKAYPLIKSALETVRAAEAELKAQIGASPQLFTKPRTVIFHGIKVGLEKSKGRMLIADAKLTIKLIRRHFAENAELLIKTTETLRRKAVSGMTGADLKRIGVELEGGGDLPVIRPVDGELEKALNALLKAAGHGGDDEHDAEGE